MDSVSVLLNIFRPRCEHAAELRTFKILNCSLSFEKLESRFLCHPDAILEIALSSSQDGPWTKLDDGDDGCDMYQAPIGLLLKQVHFKYQNSFQQNLSILQCKKDFFRIREIYPNLTALSVFTQHCLQVHKLKYLKMIRLGEPMPKFFKNLKTGHPSMY